MNFRRMLEETKYFIIGDWYTRFNVLESFRTDIPVILLCMLLPVVAVDQFSQLVSIPDWLWIGGIGVITNIALAVSLFFVRQATIARLFGGLYGAFTLAIATAMLLNPINPPKIFVAFSFLYLLALAVVAMILDDIFKKYHEEKAVRFLRHP